MKEIVNLHRDAIYKFMEWLNLDEYYLSWISFWTGVVVCMLVDYFIF